MTDDQKTTALLEHLKALGGLGVTELVLTKSAFDRLIRWDDNNQSKPTTPYAGWPEIEVAFYGVKIHTTAFVKELHRLRDFKADCERFINNYRVGK